MQMEKLRPMLKFIKNSKEFARTVATESTSEKLDVNLKSWREIPGPPSLPIIGQMHNYLPGGRHHNFQAAEGTIKLYEMYGPIVRLENVPGMSPMLFLFDPESTAQVLRGEDWMPYRPGFISLEYYRKVFKKNKGHTFQATGLSTDHGKIWKEFRSTVNPVMMQPKTIKLYVKVIDEVAQDMVARMKANRDENNMIRNKFDKEMNLWALESIGTVALGCRLNCFDSSLSKNSPESQLIQCVHDMFTISNKLDFQPKFLRFFTKTLYKKGMKLYEDQENIVKHFVQKGKAQLQKNSHKEKGVLEKLLEINEEVAYIMASDMLIAGVDTAANTVMAILYFLATHPEKQDKLREEIMSNSERKPYLRACIKESMRLMPIITANSRLTTKEYELLGYKIPKNLQILFAHQSMSLMEKNYLRAREFIPERWITSNDDPLYYGNAHPFAHSPFGFGTRTCIGRRIAELEIHTFVARLIENFQVEWFGPPPKVVMTTINYITGPFNFILRDV